MNQQSENNTLEKPRPNYRKISLVEAMELFVKDQPVFVDWNDFRRVQKDQWCELNVNHLQRGKWYVEVADEPALF